MRNTVCVCEDEALIRQTAAAVLEQEGFEVVAFRSGDEALVFLERAADVVIMIFTDIHMPGECDGVRLAHAAAESWPWIGLLVTSGTTTPVTLPAHAKFLPKPWHEAHVIEHARHCHRSVHRG